MTEILQKLREIAPFLNALHRREDARLGYELMSDSLMWSDEFPPPEEWKSLGLDVTSGCLRGIFRFRTTLMLGRPEEKFRPYWEQAQSLFPNWPGLLPERRQPDPARIQLYEESKVKALADWEALDARYESQRLEKPATV